MGPAWSAAESVWLLPFRQVRCSMKINTGQRVRVRIPILWLLFRVPLGKSLPSGPQSLGLETKKLRRRVPSHGFQRLSNAPFFSHSTGTLPTLCHLSLPLLTPGSWQRLASREAVLLRANPLWVFPSPPGGLKSEPSPPDLGFLTRGNVRSAAHADLAHTHAPPKRHAQTR